jgi:hypothetical protein
MSNRRWVVDVVATLMLCSLLVSAAAAQQVSDLYHVRDAVSQTYVEYHKVTIPKGKEVVLADLKGPAKIQDIYEFGPGADDFTSVAFWYQEEPHQSFKLQPFAEHAAPSAAHVEGKKK